MVMCKDLVGKECPQLQYKKASAWRLRMGDGWMGRAQDGWAELRDFWDAEDTVLSSDGIYMVFNP